VLYITRVFIGVQSTGYLSILAIVASASFASPPASHGREVLALSQDVRGGGQRRLLLPPGHPPRRWQPWPHRSHVRLVLLQGAPPPPHTLPDPHPVATALSYRPQLPSSATALSYRPQLPPSATALSYRPQLPPSATALSYRPQLPPLRLSCKPMHAPPAGARGGRPGLPARSAAHPVLGDCRGDEPLPKGSPRRGWGVRRDAPAIR
jgi:hypothetical protein